MTAVVDKPGTNQVKIVEVGARDGLQNESKVLDIATRIELINRLRMAGLKDIEIGSFVSPKWVPQMAGSDQVLEQLEKFTDINYPVLTPNQMGYDAAIKSGAKEVAIFGGASETFSQKNINCSIAESLARFKEITAQAKKDQVRVRGYVSCLVACPYEGAITPAQVMPVVRSLFEMGCYEVSLGDTIGRGTPKSIETVLKAILSEFPAERIALHSHDTYGMAVANTMKGLEMGLRTFDTSVGGAGGCPYAKGASGNVATEDMVYLLHQEGFNTAIDLDKIVDVGHWLFQQLGKVTPSKAGQALYGNRS